MARLPERQYNGGAWTKGRWSSFVTSALRAASRRWPPKYECLKAARTEKKINVKTGRLAQHFRCAICEEEFTSKDMQVDHIQPIGRDKTWDEFIDGLFCEIDNLQAVCIGCHKIKSKKEANESKLGSEAARGGSEIQRRTKRTGNKSSG